MKGSQIIGMLGVCLSIVSVSAYQVSEPGIFAFIAKGVEPMCQKKSQVDHHIQPVAYEEKHDGEKTSVMIVNGQSQFMQEVINQSHKQPVVVKVHSIHSSDARRMREPFQQVADQFKGMVTCVALDLFKQYEGQQENYRLIENLMTNMGLYRIDLPLFLFFKDGRLKSSSVAPRPILQGFYSRDQLANIIQKHFFQSYQQQHVAQMVKPSKVPVKQLVGKPGHDLSLTTTTTAGTQIEPKKAVNSEKKSENKDSSWWSRLKKVFK